jgi:hypothetical protein
MGIAEKRAQIEQQLAAIKEARAKRNEAEEEKLLDEHGVSLLDGSLVMLPLPETAPDLPGHYVGCRPLGPAMDRFRSIMWRDSGQRGATEAKARAGRELARFCLKYPSPSDFERLCDGEWAGAVDQIASALVRAAQAGLEAEGKG